MLSQIQQDTAAMALPQEDAASAIACCELRPVRTELDCRDPVGVPFQLVELLAVSDGEDFDNFARTARALRVCHQQ